MGTLYIIGAGPGGERFITRKAEAALDNVNHVVGWELNLQPIQDRLEDKQVEIQTIDNYQEVGEVALKRVIEGEDLALVRNGDPTTSAGLHGVLETVDDHENVDVEIIPGISSVQVAASLAGIELHRSVIASFHDKDERNSAEQDFLLEAWERERHLILLIGPEFQPPDAAEFLLTNSIPSDTRAMVGSQLTLLEEEIFYGTLADLPNRSFHWLSVMTVVHPETIHDTHQWPRRAE